MTPFFAIFGRNPTVPEDALFQIEGKKREEDMKEVWDKAKDAIEMNNEKSKKKFERTRRVKKREIKKGDLVLVNRAMPSHKLAAQRDGPFRVTETNQRIVSVETPTGFTLSTLCTDNYRTCKDDILLFTLSLFHLIAYVPCIR
ncbi:hypothetical protein PRIPAC_82223 [Pristionchus pacificus]|uniref:Uncharacterized protein n=1 Tax=Pristionchus pacificus TaxID=54126 RepID=A0A2A6BVH2_PRIPA|nr:hypothetical protein PRIPAC_82223 [Pristionchus pacificus]|eukprot:PDM69920.1 hypothetical protein PRIPAC_49132 [Pristionchus pacificus]